MAEVCHCCGQPIEHCRYCGQPFDPPHEHRDLGLPTPVLICPNVPRGQFIVIPNLGEEMQ